MEGFITVLALIFWAVKKLSQIADVRAKQMGQPPHAQPVRPSQPLAAPPPPSPVLFEEPRVRVFESMEGIDPCHDDYIPATATVTLPPEPPAQAYDMYAQQESAPSLFTGEDLVKAVVMSEILARPKYARRRL